MTSITVNRGYHGSEINRHRGSSARTYSPRIVDVESRKHFFDNQTKYQDLKRSSNNNNFYKTSQETESTSIEPPKATLLKYEVRKLVDLRKVSDKFSNMSNKTIIRARNTTVSKLATNGGHSAGCGNCEEMKRKMEMMENNFKTAGKLNSEKFHQLEEQLEKSSIEKEELLKSMKKLQRGMEKLENGFEEEKVQTRRLSIKLEDANYEIGRLRQELINSQLENEKIVEENEDLAVDNEDLIKERDEIIQIYDELYRESERLKHEVKIWKTVFENNKASLPEVSQQDLETDQEMETKSDDNVSEDEENITMEIEEDITLLLPPRNDILLKAGDPAKVFDFADELGRGKFGKIYKAVAKSTGDTYAAKYIKVTPKLREDVLNTVEMMKKIHHARLMNLFDVYDLGTQIILIQEYVCGGMLFERIMQNNKHTEADSILYVKQILQGLHHIHSQNICHLELKPENIVCQSRDSMDIKLIDFGLARQLEHKKDIKITAGSPEFVAPEILSFDPVSLASDMWSVGVVTYVMLSGISPFIGEDDNDTLLNVSCCEYEFHQESFKIISHGAKEFIKSLLVPVPKKRANVSRCLNHPWLKVTPQAKKTEIRLDYMKKFLESRKEKHNVSAVRAIRRFSSFGVGQGTLNPRNTPIMRGSSRHLTVPNAIQSSVISEDNELYEEEQIDCSVSNTPTFKITREESLEQTVPEDTDTPDGLRQYLQRMISEGHLPGGNVPSQVEGSDDEQ